MVQQGRNLLLKMKETGIVPNEHCYGAVISGYCQEKKLNEAEALFYEMRYVLFTSSSNIRKRFRHQQRYGNT